MNVEELRFGHQIQFHCVQLLLFHAYYSGHAQPISQLGETQYYRLGSDLSPTMLLAVVVLLFIFLFLVFFSIYLRHHVESRTASDSFRRATAVDYFRSCHGLDPAVIRTFPVVVHSSIKDLRLGNRSSDCAVCLSEFQDCETLRLLPRCDHVFHPNCIDAWLATRATCPVCRATLTPDCRSRDEPDAGADSRQINTSGENSAAKLGEARNHDHHHVVMIHINGAERDRDESEEDEIGNGPITSKRMEETGKFPRSHSMGHSPDLPEEDTQKYRLRSPEKLKRSASYDVVSCVLDTN